MPITNESKEALKASVDIVDVIASSLELRKSGANYTACCPFHGEKTPSFVVSPSKQIYHCFGCNAGGDVYKYVMEMEKLGFVEAVEEIASRYNYTLSYEGGGSDRVDYSRLMDAMTGFYMQSLDKSHRQYLKQRGLSAKSIKLWQIGYAPRSPQQIAHIEAQHLPLPQAEEVGIIRVDGGRRYAQFSERIMFPIRDHRGKVVGFSGRSLKPDAKAKYLNSIQSRIFDKSRLLYGWDIAKESIYRKKFAIIMEGYLDVILSHQVGISTAVASQGTALTEACLPAIRKAQAKVIIAYDGDKAGRAAAHKAAVMLSTHQVRCGVVLFPEGSDPADMIAAGEEERVKALLGQHTDGVRYVLEQIAAGHTLSDPYGVQAALTEALAYLEKLGSAVVAEAYLSPLATMLGVDRRHVTLGSAPVAAVSSAAPRVSAEEQLLYAMYRSPPWVDLAVDITEDAAWEDQARYIALLRSTATEEQYRAISLSEGVEELSEQQFVAACKAKQRAYLQARKAALLSSGDGWEEILEINQKMKEMR